MNRTLCNKIINAVSKTGTTRLAIIVDGRYYVKGSKMVYVWAESSLESEHQLLHFIVKQKQYPREKEIEDCLSNLVRDLTQSAIYGVEIPVQFTVDMCNCFVDVDLGILFLESGAYYLARQIAKDSNYKTSVYKIFNRELEKGVVLSLAREFKKQAFLNYRDVIFSGVSDRFVSRIYNRNKFYKILKTFIPVIVEYDGLYNPLLDNPDFNFKDFQIYKVAVAKNRKIDNDSGLRAYMMTHEEIAYTLGMKHFIRFTPEMLYSLIVGKINPNLKDFPSVNNNVYVKTVNSEISNRLPLVYTEEDYLLEVYKYQQKLQGVNGDGEKGSIAKKFSDLQLYTKMDSLYWCSLKNLRYMVPNEMLSMQGGKVTASEIYSYLQEIQLV